MYLPLDILFFQAYSYGQMGFVREDHTSVRKEEEMVFEIPVVETFDEGEFTTDVVMVTTCDC